MAQVAVPARGTSSETHSGWFVVGALVVVVALAAGVAGYLIGGNQAGGSADSGLVNDSSAAWSTPYDPAKVAAVYAADATFHDEIAGETSTGLEAIQAKVSNYISTYGFKVVPTSTPVREGNYIISFVDYGAAGDMSHGIAVIQVENGKIINQWIYPAD